MWLWHTNASIIMINTTVQEKYMSTTITISNHCANSNVKQDKDHSGCNALVLGVCMVCKNSFKDL